MKVRIGEIAHFRSGDKGDTCNLCVFPYDEGDYELMRDQLTEERVKEAFGPMVKGSVTRYEVPGVHGFNFVMREALGGGSTKSLAADIHGKSWSGLLAAIELERDASR